MAERRMFAKTIIDSDPFLDMPLSTQALYFQLSMRADDDGFINNPKKIQRMIGCSDDDLKLLIAKNFIIPFESGVVVIKHWKIHNYIQADRYKETVYTEEKSMLGVKDNKAYTLSPSDYDPCIQNVSKVDTQVRLGKDRLGEDSIGKVKDSPTDYAFFQKTYNEKSSLLPKCKTMTDKRKKLAREFLKTFSEEQWAEVCERANRSEFLTGSNDRGWKADIDFLLRSDKAAKILEGFYEKASYKDRYKEDGEPDFLDSLDI